ncbi:hypothetical protein G6F32_013652 [Rhizopus arrhizus]|nr:hypothetical protein G6F32_013652 [Rhizopus arrhizus]
MPAIRWHWPPPVAEDDNDADRAVAAELEQIDEAMPPKLQLIRTQMALVLRLLSTDGLRAVAERIEAMPIAKHTPPIQAFVAMQSRYLSTIGPTIAFLQGRDSTLAHRIVGRHFLPEGPRFSSLDVYLDEEGGDPLGWAFGALGLHDRAKHLATLYLNDLADVLRDVPNSVRVEGHTDNVPIATATFPSNWALSAGRAASVVRLFAATMAVLLLPKVLGYLAMLLDPVDRRGCGGAIRAFVSMLVETVLAALMAPVVISATTVASRGWR